MKHLDEALASFQKSHRCSDSKEGTSFKRALNVMHLRVQEAKPYTPCTYLVVIGFDNDMIIILIHVLR